MYAEPWRIPWVVPPGERYDYEIHFLEQGSGVFRVGDRIYQIKPGDIILLNSQEGNDFRGDIEPFRFFYVTFRFKGSEDIENLKKLNMLLKEEQFPLKLSENSNVLKLFYTMHREIVAKSFGNDLRVKLLLASLVLELLDAKVQSTSDEDIRHIINSNSYKLVNKVIVYLQDNYNSELRLEGISKIVNIHPRYLCTLFRQITGKTINEFLRQFRIEKAKKLLLYTTLSITEIAYEVGFNNSQYFSKVFSKMEGMEPRAFRKSSTFNHKL